MKSLSTDSPRWSKGGVTQACSGFILRFSKLINLSSSPGVSKGTKSGARKDYSSWTWRMGEIYSTQTSLVLSILSLFTVIIFMYFDNYNVINKKCYIFSLLKGLKFKKTKLSQSLSPRHLTHTHTQTYAHMLQTKSGSIYYIYLAWCIWPNARNWPFRGGGWSGRFSEVLHSWRVWRVKVKMWFHS